MNRIAFIAVVLVAVITGSCTGLKEITSEDPLFTGNEITITDVSKHGKLIANGAEEELTPRPNHQFLWMRPALGRYNMLSDSARLKKFWKNKIDKPVTMSMMSPEFSSQILSNRLYHNGYFNNHVEYAITGHGKTGVIEYIITLNTPYRFGEVSYPDPVNEINRLIRESMSETMIVEGDIYSLETLKEERLRIDDYLKDRGFIYFNPDFLHFRADSVSAPHTVNIEISLKPTTPPESRTSFTVKKIFVFDDYVEGTGSYDTLNYDPYFFVTADSTIKFSEIRRGLFIEPGSLYSRLSRQRTIRYLNHLPVVQSSNTSFKRLSDSTLLEARIFFYKRKRFAYSAELNTVFRSTNYLGPGVIFSFTDRNTRRKAERFQVNLRGRFEVQVAEGSINPAFELGLEVNYMIPRLVPGFIEKMGRNKIPQTQLSLGYNLFDRVDLYRLNSFYIDFGYRWRQNFNITHSLKPIDIIFTVIPESSKSDKFKDYLEDNPGVKRSFDEQFIVGSGYEFIYDPLNNDRGDIYFLAGIDLAGNLLDLIFDVANADTDTSGRYTLFGVPFSQYVKLRTDFRYGFHISRNTNIQTRVAVGLGVPFGNSDVLPYISQFYVGGTNSLRSFLARSIGPGSEVPPEGFRDLTGDIYLEWNLEYRFTISNRFKGALFADVGNIWLYNDDPSRPKGVFKFDTFGQDLAVSAGWGLRWDFNFVVARLDFAYTIRTPYLPEGEKWIRKFRFFNPTVNIAIGYPF